MTKKTYQPTTKLLRAIAHNREHCPSGLGPELHGAGPTDMEERLRRHGLQKTAYRLPAMVAPLAQPQKRPAISCEVEIWQAQSRAELEAASTIRRRAFQFK